MKFSKTFALLIIFLVAALNIVCAQVNDLTLKVPEGLKEFEESIPSVVEIKNLPNFPEYKKEGTNRISATEDTILLNTRFRLVVDSNIDFKVSMVGDYFKASVLEDFYIPTKPPQLIVPAKSWVRGKIDSIKKPTFFSMSGKIGLELYQLVTPLGEVATLNAEFEIQQGIVNSEGLLDPVISSDAKDFVVQELTISMLGISIIDKLIAGKLTALIFEPINISLNKGQELQIVLQKELKL